MVWRIRIAFCGVLTGLLVAASSGAFVQASPAGHDSSAASGASYTLSQKLRGSRRDGGI